MQYILQLLHYTITYSSHFYVSWTRAIHCNGCYYITYQLSIFLPLGLQTALFVPHSCFIGKNAWPLLKNRDFKIYFTLNAASLGGTITILHQGLWSMNMDEKESRRVLEHVNLKIIVIIHCKWTMNVIYYKWKILSLWFFLLLPH